MTKLEQKLQEIKKRKRIGLMSHVVIGYPSLKETIEIVMTMTQNGVDIIELQIPFSDPLADGATITRACEESLKKGTKVLDAFTVMKSLSKKTAVPLLFMAYYNTVFMYGVEMFCKDAKQAGAEGLIVPDMPIDEEGYEHFFAFCKQYDIPAICVISPSSTDKRLKNNARFAKGFVYCTARQGITGASSSLEKGVSMYIEKVKNYFTIPIAVGFGISKKEHVLALQGHADIAVVGSAIITIISASKKHEVTKNVAAFIKEIKTGRS